MPTRRTFLKTAGAVSLIAGAPAIVSRKSLGQVSWGEVPSGILPAGYQPKSILEIHCFGAPSIWENFWVSATVQGNPPNETFDPNWRAFDAEMEATQWLCPPAPGDRPESEGIMEFGQDSLGNRVFWGPATRPLWTSGIFDRVRMVVQAHDQPAIPIHEAAIPFAVTGTRLGTPRHAASGAAFQHRANIVSPDRTIPSSYVLSPNNTGVFSMVDTAAVATGKHPGGSRPLLVKIGGDDTLTPRLARSNMTPEADALLDALRGQYRDRLRHHGGIVAPVRSAHFASYDAAVNALYGAPQLIDLFSGGVLAVSDTPYCLKEQGDADPADMPNRPATAVNLARQLLTNPDNPARHVFIADGGVERIAGNSQPPYDTHASLVVDGFEQVRATNANLFNVLYHLAQAIDPTGLDPTKINLDNTMIVINSEFGRTPTRSSDQGESKGREHFPSGYVAILIGGPITSRAIVGGLTSTPGQSGDGVSPDGHWHKPTDIRGAVLLAGGIWPFAEELFGTLDFGPRINVGTEDGNAEEIVQSILGL